MRSIALISDDERIIQGVSCDSRDIEKDWLFVAIQGVQQSGEDFIEEVLEKGGIVLSEQKIDRPNTYQCVQVSICLGILINEYYERPSEKLYVIGITGTNGKTSVAWLLKQMFEANQQKVTLIGTNGIEIANVHEINYNTTPGIMTNLAIFQKSIKQNIPILIMEISSQAINENRIAFIRFDTIIYTNITHEHLDYHKTFIHYQYTKFKARFYLKDKGKIILNQDRFELHEFFDLRRDGVVTFGARSGHLLIEDIELKDSGSNFMIENTRFSTDLLSMNSIYNITACLVLFKMLHIQPSKLVEVVASLQPIEGRMEVLKFKQQTIWIDFAHTPDALRRLLVFASSVKRGKVITVIGCGGERDREKRHQMGTIASSKSDIAIFTEDNSRHEKTGDIIEEMMLNVLNNVIVKEKREDAIALAVDMANESDIIIVAGKGNEQFLIVNDDKIPYNDKAFIQHYIARKEGSQCQII